MTRDGRIANQPAMRGFFLIWAALMLLVPTSVSAEDQPAPAGELGKVIGKDAAALILLLGPPVQDIREGSGRKLQFANTSCIFDVYLYPQGEDETPIAVYTAARVPDGRDAERNSCITALRWRR